MDGGGPPETDLPTIDRFFGLWNLTFDYEALRISKQRKYKDDEEARELPERGIPEWRRPWRPAEESLAAP